MRPLALSVVVNALLLLLALIAYDQVARTRELRVAVVDVAAVYRWKEAQFTALLIQPGSAANAPQLAADFARRLPQALDEIATECQCLLLTRAVLAGQPAPAAGSGAGPVADWTATLQQKLGLP